MRRKDTFASQRLEPRLSFLPRPHPHIGVPTLPPDCEHPWWMIEVQLAVPHLQNRHGLAVPVDPRVIVVFNYG